MFDLSGASKAYLHQLRSDARFAVLLSELEIPHVPSFHPSKTQKDGLWEYWSGQKDGAKAILSVLKGTTEVLND